MYAVIRAGGKQYKVSSGDVIDVDRLAVGAGETVSFPALMVVDGDKVSNETTRQVSGEVIAHPRGRKIRVFNYHAKTGWKRTKGHRSNLTTVKITEIG